MAAFLAAFTAHAQLVTNPQQIPDTGKPPVVFLNGYQFGCPDRGTFAGTFGAADALLQLDQRVSLFFNNCDVPGNLPIEDLGNAFRDYLGGLKYVDGRAVPQVDIVAHSMGGMIVRSYLAGKQRDRGLFHPPADVKIRKAVFVTVPFFGAVASDVSSPDEQSRQLQIGSPFTFDLATWNQGRDDMRGIDAVAVVATGGSGILNRPRFDDSTVSVTSGSLEWYAQGRTRVIPNFCHTVLTGILALACTNPSSAIARMNAEEHPVARVMRSFLSDTTEWTTVGDAPTANEYLKDRAGIQIQVRGSQDQILRVDSGTPNMNVRGNEIAWADFAATATPFPITLSLENGSSRLNGSATLAPGFTSARVLGSDGPLVNAVLPNYSRDMPERAVAPGSFIAIYGERLSTSTGTGASPYPPSLGGAEVLLGGQSIGLQYARPDQINAIVPDSASGVMRLRVRTANGVGGINLHVEAAVPSLYSTTVNAISGALVTSSAPIHPGEYLSIYATGLGLTERRADGLEWALIQPNVTVGGQPCTVLFAGRSPNFVGLDQINCQISANASVSDTAPVLVQSGRRSASIAIPIR